MAGALLAFRGVGQIQLMMNDSSPRLAFGRSSRILNAKDYSAVMRARLRIGGTLFVGHAMRRGDTAAWRLGLIVPKKLEPSAVRRNALKRVWREHFRRECAALEQLHSGHDLVVRLAFKPTSGALLALKRACLSDAKALLESVRLSIR